MKNIVRNDNKFNKVIVLFNLILYAIIGQLALSGSDDIYVRAFKYDSLKSFLYTRPHLNEIINSKAIPKNGRYISNYLCYIINELSEHYGNIIRGIFLSLIIIYFFFALANFISKNKLSKNALIASSFFVLLAPQVAYAEMYTWLAGSLNYLLPLATLLVIFNVLLKDEVTRLNKVTLFVFTVANMLIVEHISVYMLFIAFILFVNRFTKGKYHFNTNGCDVIFIVTTLIGAIIMFSNENYIELVKNLLGIKSGYSYQSLAPVKTMSVKNKLLMLSRYFSNTVYIILPIISVLLSSIAKRKKKYILMVSTLIFSFSTLVLYFCYAVSANIKVGNIGGIISVIAFILVLLSVMILMEKSKEKVVILFFSLSSVLIASIFFFLNPAKARGFYVIYIFMIIIALELYRYLKKNDYKLSININKKMKHLAPVLFLISLVVISIYSASYVMFYQNDKYIKEQMKNKETVITIAENTFMDKAITKNRIILYFNHFIQKWDYDFLYYYEKPRDIDFKFVSYSEWVKNYK